MIRRLIIVAAAALISACVTVPTRSPEPHASGPVLDLDFPDPFILPEGRTLFAYATNTVRDGRRLHVQLSRSDDGRNWAEPRDAMPTLPTWVQAPDGDVWAPEVIKLGDRYVLYFAARSAEVRRRDGLTLCVGAAVSSEPQGPFVPQPAPLTCDGPDGAIDPSPFREGDRLWLYVKTDGNCCGDIVRFLALPLSPDGLSVVGDATPLPGIASDSKWEGDVIEAPQMVRHGQDYFLFFSGNDYGGPDYGIGYAQCDGPLGPCHQAAENPIVRSTEGLIGPGHETVFETGGASYLAYHAWRRGPDGKLKYRALYVAPLDWPDGRPHAQTLPKEVARPASLQSPTAPS